MKDKKLTKGMQKAAADILTQFMFVMDMDDLNRTWYAIYKQYDLCDDPFTNTPCTQEEYAKNRLEYDKQVMMEKYGHCDGLD